MPFFNFFLAKFVHNSYTKRDFAFKFSVLIFLMMPMMVGYFKLLNFSTDFHPPLAPQICCWVTQFPAFFHFLASTVSNIRLPMVPWGKITSGRRALSPAAT